MEANNSSSRISAAAYAYQVAMSISNVTAETIDTQTNPSQAEAVKDTTINNHAVEVFARYTADVSWYNR
jgi:hypothetical protein